VDDAHVSFLCRHARRWACAAAALCALLATASAALTQPVAAPAYCVADARNTFRVRVDIFASTFGEFTIDGCEGTSPTLLLTRGVSYTFAQADVTNIGHPLAFAYAPDGPLAGAPPLAEPTPRACAAPRLGCEPGVARQAPRYFIDGAAAGACCANNTLINRENDDDAMSAAARDTYVLSFQLPEAAWAARTHSVRLAIPPASKTATFFYHCALFPGMSGRVDVAPPAAGAALPGGLNALPAPFNPSAYYERLRSPSTGLDVVCGTRGLSSGMMGTMMAGGGGRGGGMMMSGGSNASSSCGADTPVGQFATCMRAIEHAMMAPMMPGMMMRGGGCQDPV
jgi:hypothetical protein